VFLRISQSLPPQGLEVACFPEKVPETGIFGMRQHWFWPLFFRISGDGRYGRNVFGPAIPVALPVFMGMWAKKYGTLGNFS